MKFSEDMKFGIQAALRHSVEAETELVAEGTVKAYKVATKMEKISDFTAYVIRLGEEDVLVYLVPEGKKFDSPFTYSTTLKLKAGEVEEEE